jgi:Tfp pilus assembly protein PilW
VELVTTMGLLLVVLASILRVFESVNRSAALVRERSETLDSMRLALDRMTKEIRQARLVTPDAAAPATALTMQTYVLGQLRTIRYAASGQRLTRSVDGGAAVPIQDNLSSTSLFAYTTDAVGVVQVVTITLRVHPARRPDTTLVLTSEVRLRNRSPS